MFVLIVLCLGNVEPTYSDTAVKNNDTEIDQKQLANLKKKISALKKKLNQFEGKRSGLIRSLQQVEVAMSELEIDIRSNQNQISKTQKRIGKLSKQRDALKRSQATQRELIGEQISSHYKMGREPYLKLLLSEEDPGKVERLNQYFDYFSRARVEQIKAYQIDIAELDAVEQKIEVEQTLLSNKQQSLATKHQALKEKSRQRKTVVSQLNSKIKSGEKRLGNLDADQKRLENLINSLAKTTADLAEAGLSQPFAKTKGSLLWPTKGRITRKFGSTQKPSNLRWKGVTLSTSEGRSVHSIHHGRVIFSGWLRGHGLILVVEHDKHYMSIYAYNQTLLKEVGDWVTAGEQIATVGVTGGQEKPALYFEIRKDGNPINPELWCSSKR